MDEPVTRPEASCPMAEGTFHPGAMRSGRDPRAELNRRTLQSLAAATDRTLGSRAGKSALRDSLLP